MPWGYIQAFSAQREPQYCVRAKGFFMQVLRRAPQDAHRAVTGQVSRGCEREAACIARQRCRQAGQQGRSRAAAWAQHSVKLTRSRPRRMHR